MAMQHGSRPTMGAIGGMRDGCSDGPRWVGPGDRRAPRVEHARPFFDEFWRFGPDKGTSIDFGHGTRAAARVVDGGVTATGVLSRQRGNLITIGNPSVIRSNSETMHNYAGCPSTDLGTQTPKPRKFGLHRLTVTHKQHFQLSDSRIRSTTRPAMTEVRGKWNQ